MLRQATMAGVGAIRPHSGPLVHANEA